MKVYSIYLIYEIVENSKSRIFRKSTKCKKFHGYTFNKRIAESYIESSDKELYFEEDIFDEVDYCNFTKKYWNKKILCYKFENDDDYICIRKCDRQQFMKDNGVVLV